MTKEKTINNSTIDPTIPPISDMLPVNYPALEYVTWFMTDSQNVQNLANSIFRGGFNKDDPRFVELLNATNKSIQEIEDDIAKIKEFLAAYIPSNNN